MSQDKPEIPNTEVYWKRSKKLNSNLKNTMPEGCAGLNLLPANTLMCNLPEGLVIMGSKWEIVFRYVLNRYQHYQIGISTHVRDNTNPDMNHRTIWQYTGRLNHINELKWFNRTVEELIPMALQMYS